MQDGAGPRPFDTTTRRLIEVDPASWLHLAGLPVNGPVHPLQSDVSTVLAEVDKLLHVDAASPWLAHLEVQSSRDARLPSRLLQYHALLHHRHRLPVASTVFLLRPAADGPELTGRLDLPGPADSLTLSFWYRVVRLWEVPVEDLLAGGLGVLPLAAMEPDRLPEVIRQIETRIGADLPRTTVDEFWSTISLLLGLRYDEGAVRDLLRRFPHMRESITYQIILEEGREEGRIEGELRRARRTVLDLGADKFGPADSGTAARIQQLDDLDTLDRLIHGVLRVNNWQELLALIPAN